MDNGRILERKLLRELKDRLPEKMDQTWSRRIEGMTTNNPVQGEFEKLLLLIDQNLSDERFYDIKGCLMNAMRRCYPYKNTKIRIMFWDGDYTDDKFKYQNKIRESLAKMHMNQTRTGTQEELTELLEKEVKQKKCPLILILADDKLAEMVQKLDQTIYRRLITVTWNQAQEIKPAKRGISLFTYVKDFRSDSVEPLESEEG